MPTSHIFEYAIIRIIPRVERGECINAGIILFARTLRFLEARTWLNTPVLTTLAPELDLQLVQQHLDLIHTICKGGKSGGPIGLLPMPERFHWLVAPRSTVIQTSAVHGGLCTNAQLALEQLFERLVL
jgi:hypothetical protein